MDDPHHALQLLRDQRHDRARFACDIEEGLAQSTFYSTSLSRLGSAIRQALHEDDQYAALTGEQLPEHHQQVLRVELSYWMEYDDLLRATPVSEERYAGFCAALRPRAAKLTRIIGLEEDLLGTPLVAHYAQRLARITGGTEHRSPTRDPVRALAQLRDDRAQRRYLAHTAYRHVLRETFFDTGTTDLTFGLHHAGEDQTFYEDATGEVYPAHAVRANEFERSLWQHLLTVHERGARHRALSCRRLKPLARILARTLELEDDLLTTPLSAYYERHLDELAQAAHRTDKTFRTGDEP